MPLRGICTGGNQGMTGISSSIPLALPAGSAIGDVLVAIITTQGTPAVTPPASASLITVDSSSANNARTYIYVSTLTSDDIAAGSLTWTTVVSNHHTGAGVVRYGVSASDLILSAVTRNVGTTLTLGTISTPSAGYEIAILLGSRAQSGPVPDIVSYPTGYSLGQSSRTNAAGLINTGSFTGRQDSSGAAGTYGGDTVTYASSCTSQGYVLALPSLVAPVKRPRVLVAGVSRPGVADGVIINGILRPITVRGVIVNGVVRPLP